MRISTVVIIIFKNIELALRDLFGLGLSPYKLLLELTDYCNSKCKTCHIWKTGESAKLQINTGQLEPVLREYGRHLLWVALSGGETTLYPECDKLVELLSLHCPNLRIVTFTTNALQPQKVLELAIKLKKAGFDLFVTISLDGDEKTHDHIRGVNGNFQLAQKCMQLLQQNKIWTHFGLTVSALNRDYILNGGEMAKTRAFSFEHSGGIYKTDSVISDMSPSIRKIKSDYKIRQLGEIVEYLYLVMAEKFFAPGEKKLPVPCEVLATSLHIRPNGDITPCMYLPSIGNIKDTTIGKALATTEAQKLRNRALTGDCHKCWMNCYAPHSIMRHPWISLKNLFSA